MKSIVNRQVSTTPEFSRCSPPNRSRRTPAIILTAVAALSAFAAPVQAAVIDQVRDKVDTIKDDTNTIKGRTLSTSRIVDRVQDKVSAIKSDANTIKNQTSTLVSQAADQLRETVDIRGALEPLFELRARFDEIGIYPTELLDMLPADEIQDLIDEYTREAREARERLNDPDLESYRQEFVAVLRGLSEAVSDNGVVEVSPLQTLVEQAPPAVLGLIKAATEPFFAEFTDNVVSIVQLSSTLNDLGAFELVEISSSPVLTPRTREIIARVGCETAEGFRPGIWALNAYRLQLNKALQNLKDVGVFVKTKGQKEFDIGVHGYLGYKFKAGSNVKKAQEQLKNKLERRAADAGIIQSILTSVRSQVSACDFVSG